MPITEPVAFIKELLANADFRRELEEEDRRKWEAFTLRLLARLGFVELGRASRTFQLGEE